MKHPNPEPVIEPTPPVTIHSTPVAIDPEPVVEPTPQTPERLVIQPTPGSPSFATPPTTPTSDKVY